MDTTSNPTPAPESCRHTPVLATFGVEPGSSGVFCINCGAALAARDFLHTLAERLRLSAENLELGNYAIHARTARAQADALDAIVGDIPRAALEPIQRLIDTPAERVHCVILPRERAPYALGSMAPSDALDRILRFHLSGALAWDFLSDMEMDSDGAALEIYTLRETVDTYPAGAYVFGVWDARYRDDSEEARPMLRVLRGASADKSAILAPWTQPGIVRVAKLDDLATESDKFARVWEFEDCGLDSASYFRGAGADSFDDCAVGCGNTAREALDDALDMLASSGWDVGACALAIPADNGGAWDKDMVGEALAESVEPARVRVRFLASCGMDTAEGGEFDSAEEALECVRGILERRAMLDGFEVDPFEDDSDDSVEHLPKLREALESHDADFALEWEARSGDNVSMIPDTDGTLYLDILPGVSIDEISEDSDLSYRVCVRVSEHADTDSDDSAPCDPLAIVQALARPHLRQRAK